MGWNDTAPTSQELNTVGWDSSPPTNTELGKRSVSDAFRAEGIKGATNQIATNAKAAWNSNPTEEQKNEAAKHPITGMEDPAYQYGVGLVGQTNALKGLGNLLKSGKAKITSLLSSEHGLHPIIEAAEETSPLNPYTKDIFSMRATREGMQPTLPDLRAARAAVPETEVAMREVFDPFTKTTKVVPVSASTSEAAPVAEAASKQSGSSFGNLIHKLHLPASSQAAGAAIGGYAAHKADLPHWAQLGAAAAGAKAGPLAVQAFLKTKDGLIPIMEMPAVNAAARAAAATQSGENK